MGHNTYYCISIVRKFCPSPKSLTCVLPQNLYHVKLFHIIFNPFVTGSTLLCGCRFELVEVITLYVVAKNHLFNMFLYFWSIRFRIRGQFFINISLLVSDHEKNEKTPVSRGKRVKFYSKLIYSKTMFKIYTFK